MPNKTGFLVPVEDVDALSEATGHLMRDAALRESFATQAREKAVTQHKLVHEAEAITAIYRRLLAA